MEDNETLTIPLLDADMFKKQLKNYYNLFHQQQTTTKESKRKKKIILEQDEEENSNIKSKVSKESAPIDQTKLSQFKVSLHNTVTGIIEFNHDSKKIALEYTIHNPKTKKIYKEIIYLPILIDMNEIINLVKKIKHDKYLNFKYEILNHQISKNNFDFTEIISLENELLSIIQDIKKDNIDNINNELEAENELLVKYRMLYDNLRSYSDDISKKKSSDYVNTMNDYLMVNQTLNHVVDDNNNIIIYPGTRVSLNDKNGIIINIDNTGNVYHVKFKDEEDIQIIPIPKKTTGQSGEISILSSVRNNISKNKSDIISKYINLSYLLKKVKNKQLLLDILSMLNINLSKPDIDNRPRLEIYTNIVSKIPKKITIIDKINTFYTTIDLKDIFNNQQNIIIGRSIKHTPDDMDIQLDNWRQLLSINNISNPFIIDDFEFNSVKHYHIASQFYNREDLSYNLRMEYNNYFIKFTNNYSGSGSLSKIDTNLCRFHTENSRFVKPITWSRNLINGDSLESIYLKKAYYNKFIQNKELRDALIKTYPRIIYEKIGKDKLYVNYELMLVRYYLYNNINPYFSKFNYNPSIYKRYIEETSQKKDYEYKLLINVFVKHSAYENRKVFFENKDILYNEYNRLDIGNKTSFELLSKYCHELLFSYNSVFIYELVENFIFNETNSNKSIDELIKKYNLSQDESIWIFNFYYEYITIKQNEKQQTIQDDLLFENQFKEKYRALQATLKANNYLIVESAIRSDSSFLDSIIEFLNRNKFTPFDFTSNKYSYSEVSYYKNNVLNNKEFPVYEFANKYLESLMTELYDLNNSSNKPFNEIDFFERLELLSRILSLDIQIISELYIDDILLKEVKEKYPKLLEDKIVSYEQSRGRLVLGTLENTEYFFPTKPYFASKDREDIKYLIAIDSNYVIEENISENGDIEHSVIGRWDPINITLNNKDTDAGDKLYGDIEIEDFMLYKLGSRIYYKDRELYF